MQVLTIGFLLLFGQLIPGGAKQGREGNRHYENDNLEHAADAYNRGLEFYRDGLKPDGTLYGLQHNLGSTLHRQENFDGAQAAFAQALEHATSDMDYARAAYNAGNNAFRKQEAEAALEHWRQALLADPTNADAKFNYEFVKRQQQEQQEQNQEQEQDQSEQQDQQNQDQKNQDQENQQENQDQSGSDQQSGEQNKNEQQSDDHQSQGQSEPAREQQLSREQAERILQALANEEEQLLREVQKVKGRPRRVAKDW